MNFNAAVATCFRKYAVFSGRAPRSEYWWFTLFLLLAGFALGLADALFFLTPADQTGPLNTIFTLATLLPSLAVGARRLHDVDRTGWWLLLWLVPVLGWLILLWWTVQPGTRGPNRFGPDPLGGDDGPGETHGPYRRSPIPKVSRRD